MSMGRWLYLPIDVKVRELDGKLFFAARAALRGWNVVIGQKKQVAAVMSRLPPGIFSGFGGQENFAEQYRRLRASGHRILVLDEEGLVTHNEDIYARTKLSPETLSRCDLFAVWGDVQRDMVLRRRPELEKKIVISGSPRLDVARPDFAALRTEEAEKLRSRFGRFILFNSNFGSSNHFMGADAYLESLRTKKIIQSEAEAVYYRRYSDYRDKVMQGILAVLPTLSAAFSDMNIVVRPHPAERADAWKDGAAGLSNVHVLHEGPVLPWIAAAQCVLHNFCTTAIESYALGVPAVSYRPVIDDTLESPLPTLVSHVAKTPEELVPLLRRVIGEKPPAPPVTSTEVRRYACNLGDGPFASDTLLDAMEKLDAPESAGWRREIPAAIAEIRLRSLARKVRGRLASALKSQKEKSADYVAHKFPGLAHTEVVDVLQRLSAAQAELSEIKVTPLDESLFMVRR